MTEGGPLLNVDISGEIITAISKGLLCRELSSVFIATQLFCDPYRTSGL